MPGFWIALQTKTPRNQVRTRLNVNPEVLGHLRVLRALMLSRHCLSFRSPRGGRKGILALAWGILSGYPLSLLVPGMTCEPGPLCFLQISPHLLPQNPGPWRRGGPGWAP